MRFLTAWLENKEREEKSLYQWCKRQAEKRQDSLKEAVSVESEESLDIEYGCGRHFKDCDCNK